MTLWPITTLLSLETKSLALQGLDTDDIEGCKFSKKFRVETSVDMDKLMAYVGH